MGASIGYVPWKKDPLTPPSLHGDPHLIMPCIEAEPDKEVDPLYPVAIVSVSIVYIASDACPENTFVFQRSKMEMQCTVGG